MLIGSTALLCVIHLLSGWVPTHTIEETAPAAPHGPRGRPFMHHKPTHPPTTQSHEPADVSCTISVIAVLCLHVKACYAWLIIHDRKLHILVVPHLALCPPAIQSCFWHTSPQYRAVLHCGHTLNTFRRPTTSHPSLWQ